jgi:hypothetical protein
VQNRTEESGHCRLDQASQVIGVGNSRLQPIILSTDPSQLELECAYSVAQLDDLVDKAPVGRAAYVAEEGLGHIVSLFSAAGNRPVNARPGFAAYAQAKMSLKQHLNSIVTKEHKLNKQ